MRPASTSGTSPLRMCRSVPQMVVATIFTTTSVESLITGRGTSSQLFSPGPLYTSAFIVCPLVEPVALGVSVASTGAVMVFFPMVCGAHAKKPSLMLGEPGGEVWAARACGLFQNAPNIGQAQLLVRFPSNAGMRLASVDVAASRTLRPRAGAVFC